MLSAVAGAPFEVELPSASGTGYMWELLPLPDGVTLLTKRFAQRAPSSVGEGGAQVFEMQAQRPGRMQVRFALKRRWEPTPVETHTVDIDVG